MSVNIFNSFQKFLGDQVGGENQFTRKFKEILIYDTFYSADQFFKYCRDL
jgi:hypothetical protein